MFTYKDIHSGETFSGTPGQLAVQLVKVRKRDAPAEVLDEVLDAIAELVDGLRDGRPVQEPEAYLGLTRLS